MTQPPTHGVPRRRQLNIEGIKRWIVLFVGALTALGSAVTGIGAQVAFAPMLTWMLGFNADKAQGTALRYATSVTFAVVVGLIVGHHATVGYFGRGFLLFLGATIGAVLAASFTKNGKLTTLHRIFQTVGIGVTLFTLLQAVRLSPLINPHFASWGGYGAVTLLGLGVGALTQIFGLPGGLLMVPTLFFLGGFTGWEAIALSLLVIALASILPSWSYARRGLVDTVFGSSAVLGGLIGGFAGGLLLPSLTDGVALALFAVVGMFLCARELARTAG